MTATNGSTTPAAASAPSTEPITDDEEETKHPFWKIWAFSLALAVDVVLSVILLTFLIPGFRQAAGESSVFIFYSSLIDVFFLAVARLALAFLALIVSFCRAKVKPEFSFPLTHPNGEKKSRDELELEALEEPFWPWFKRFVFRIAFWSEVFCIATQIFCVAKCLVRLNYEIGVKADSEPDHPLFWVAVLVTTVFSAVESSYLDAVCNLAAALGKKHYGDNTPLSRVSSALNIPLLSGQDSSHQEGTDTEQSTPEGQAEEEPRAVSDITADAKYKASWTDLLILCVPDLHIISVAFVFLVLAAIAQVYIPKYLGNILDALAEAFASNDDDASHHISMWDIPGFMENVNLLVIASILAGVFSGIRGSCFSVVGGRVNVRLRVKLMDALLSQDIAFFDMTKTGDITSRLSSDTTLVGNQVSLNVNVFLRSLVQAIGVLVFMFVVSWQLSILAFIPLITVLSKWYGEYVEALTKLMQKKLADGNSVSEATFTAMPTVRAFDAGEKELSEFEVFMEKYLYFNVKNAVAYCGYAAFVTSLPQLVFAVVVFYGGLMVRNGDMSSGQLVSFLLYLTSLSDAFADMGYIFSSLTQAVGAADKVFELMNRKPKLKSPSRNDIVPRGQLEEHQNLPGISASKTREQRSAGLWPAKASGAIQLDDVELYYPARPTRRVLNGLSLKIEPGSVVALVGESGGGKSSIVSLVQHLYEPTAGKVMLDGVEVHELSPSWLSKHVSIVNQQPTLFGRSIKRNIMYGLEGTDSEPTMEAIVYAAQLANADSFIQKLPQKYDTEVGERGVQLSGGQRQRIAIARALVRKPQVLLLDEATSALDAESEHLVQEAIDGMIARQKQENGEQGGMTVVIIAHRLSTIRSADIIYVVKEGKVVEEGSHKDLIANPEGSYAALIKRQMNAEEKLEVTKDANST